MQSNAYIFDSSIKPNQRKALLALLEGGSLAAAATAAGVHKTTCWRWLQEPAFQAANREGRRLLVERALGELQQATSEAVKALSRNLTAEKSSDQIKAAIAILDISVKAIEWADFEQRLEELERAKNARP